METSAPFESPPPTLAPRLPIAPTKSQRRCRGSSPVPGISLPPSIYSMPRSAESTFRARGMPSLLLTCPRPRRGVRLHRAILRRPQRRRRTRSAAKRPRKMGRRAAWSFAPRRASSPRCSRPIPPPPPSPVRQTRSTGRPLQRLWDSRGARSFAPRRLSSHRGSRPDATGGEVMGPLSLRHGGPSTTSLPTPLPDSDHPPPAVSSSGVCRWAGGRS